jgi:cob(I)alamin adenosyltransferase
MSAESSKPEDESPVDNRSASGGRRRRQATVTTRTGDDGYTGLLGKARVPKWHPRPEAYGTLDEATSALGLARALTPSDEVRVSILELQREIYLLMAELATDPDEYDRSPFRITADHVANLELRSAGLQQQVDIGQQFIIPGETAGAAAIDLARTIVRRGERLVARMLHDGALGNHELLRYLNRLSDVLFILARYEEEIAGHGSRSTRR